MRLLFIAEKYAPDLGGVSASATRISRQIAEIGSEVEVFCFTGRLQAGQVTVEESAPGLRIHRMGEAKNLDYSLQLAVTYLDWLHEQRAVTAVWGHYVSTAGFLAAWFARRRGLKSILSVRGNDFDRQLFPPGDLARLQWSLTAGDYITVVSRELSNHVRAFCGRTSMVLPNAVDGDTFTPGTRNSELTQKFGLKPSEIVLGFVGELRAKKGLQFLLATLQALLNLQETRLLVIGELRSADQGVWARALASDERLASAIFITGHLSASADVAAHLRLADVFFAASFMGRHAQQRAGGDGDRRAGRCLGCRRHPRVDRRRRDGSAGSPYPFAPNVGASARIACHAGQRPRRHDRSGPTGCRGAFFPCPRTGAAR